MPFGEGGWSHLKRASSADTAPKEHGSDGYHSGRGGKLLCLVAALNPIAEPEVTDSVSSPALDHAVVENCRLGHSCLPIRGALRRSMPSTSARHRQTFVPHLSLAPLTV